MDALTIVAGDLVLGAGAAATANYATSLSFSGSAGTLEIGAESSTASSLGLTDALTVGTGNTVQLDSTTGAVQLTDAAGITMAGGSMVENPGNASANGTIATTTTITGYGTVGIDLLNGTGGGTITASGGTLDLTGQVNQGAGTDRTLAIATAGGDLEIGGTAASGAISISTANQMLEIGPTGSLTITGAESITNGAIKLDGGTATLDDTNVNGLTIGSGAILEGAGAVEGPINATSGTIAANYNEGYGGVGGTLDLQGKVTAGTLELYGWSSNTLKFDAAGNTAISVIDPSGNGDYGTLEIGAGGGLTLTDALNTTTNATIKLDRATPPSPTRPASTSRTPLSRFPATAWSTLRSPPPARRGGNQGKRRRPARPQRRLDLHRDRPRGRSAPDRQPRHGRAGAWPHFARHGNFRYGDLCPGQWLGHARHRRRRHPYSAMDQCRRRQP